MLVFSFLVTRAFVAAFLTSATLGIAVLLEAPQPPTNLASLAFIWFGWFVVCLTIPEPPASGKQ